jgi:hypothetical protein
MYALFSGGTPMKVRICFLIDWFAHRFCPDMLWNHDMSLEIDRLTAENDQLRERVAELEGRW